MRHCDYGKLERVVCEQFQLGADSIHGPKHWMRVERYGIELSRSTGADELVVRLFALLHDSQRMDDDVDPDHGSRAAEYAISLRGKLFDLDDAAFERLVIACDRHSHSMHHTDPTIGTCWDADRLDLDRLDPDGANLVDPNFMSTEAGRNRALMKSKY